VNTAHNWYKIVAVAHGAGMATCFDQGVTVRRINGGANNALYQVKADGQSYACKL